MKSKSKKSFKNQHYWSRPAVIKKIQRDTCILRSKHYLLGKRFDLKNSIFIANLLSDYPKFCMHAFLPNMHLMMETVLWDFGLWIFHGILDCYFLKIFNKFVFTSNLSSESAQISHANLITLLVLDIANGFEHSYFKSVFWLKKHTKICFPPPKW